MKKIGVATDSHSGILPKQAVQLGIRVLPMPFYVNEECYYEGVSIVRDEFFIYLNEGKKVTTSQPSPEAVMEFWREGLREYDQIVYIPMSSGLSGSCHTAIMLSRDEEFEGKVLDAQLQSAIEKRMSQVNGNEKNSLIRIVVEDEKKYEKQAVATILSHGDCIGAVVVLSSEKSQLQEETILQQAKTMANFLGKHMEQ